MRQGHHGHPSCLQGTSLHRLLLIQHFTNSIQSKAQNTYSSSIMLPFMLHDFTLELYYIFKNPNGFCYSSPASLTKVSPLSSFHNPKWKTKKNNFLCPRPVWCHYISIRNKLFHIKNITLLKKIHIGLQKYEKGLEEYIWDIKLLTMVNLRNILIPVFTFLCSLDFYNTWISKNIQKFKNMTL